MKIRSGRQGLQPVDGAPGHPAQCPGHTPMRTCVVCRLQAPKSVLRRFVRAPNLKPLADPRQILPGRGFYVCNQFSCLDKLMSIGKRRKRRKGEMHG